MEIVQKKHQKNIFRNGPGGATALMGASRRGHSRIVELLLQVFTNNQSNALHAMIGDIFAGNHVDFDVDDVGNVVV